MRISSGTTDQYIYFVAVDSTDFTTRETGLSSFTVYRSRNGGAAAAMTSPTINETDSSNMPGDYELLVDEDTTIAAGNDEEEMIFHITHAGMAPVTRTISIYRPKFTEGESGNMGSSGVNVSALAANVVTAASIATSAIGESEIAGNAITAAKIGTGAITAAALAADTIGASELADTAIAEIADGVWDEILTGATHNISTSAGRRIRELQESAAVYGGAIWIDTTANGTAGTTDYENGTSDNPVDSIADANTLAASVGLSRFKIAPGSSITFAAAQENQIFEGSEWTLALGSQSIAGTLLVGATVSGTGSGANAHFVNCDIGTVTVAGCRMGFCRFTDTITFSAASDYYFHDCYSGMAGAGTPTIDFGAGVANTNLSMRRYSGGITIDEKDATGTDQMSLEGNGQLIVGASSGGAISVRGNFKVTNTGGATITYDDNTQNAIDILTDTGTTIPGLLNPTLLVSDSIDALVDQVTFTLTSAASSDDDVYNGAIIIITDQTNSWQKTVSTVKDYVGSSRQVTLQIDEAIFTIATGDLVDIVALRIGPNTIDAAAFTNAKFAAGAITATEASVNISEIGGVAISATQLSASAGTMVIGTVDDTSFSPTTTEFESDDVTTAVENHWNARSVIFTSGTLQYQAREIEDYALVGGRGHFTVAALTSAPADGVTFIIV